MSGKKRKVWRCDVCLVAVFDDYDVALAHEARCEASPAPRAFATSSSSTTREEGAVNDATIPSVVTMRHRSDPSFASSPGGSSSIATTMLEGEGRGGRMGTTTTTTTATWGSGQRSPGDDDRQSNPKRTAQALAPVTTDPMEVDDGSKINVLEEKTEVDRDAAAKAVDVEIITEPHVHDGKVSTQKRATDIRQTPNEDFKYTFAKTAMANHRSSCGLENQKAVMVTPNEASSRLSSHADRRHQPSTADVAFDSVGRGSCPVEVNVKGDETTDGIREQRHANEGGESSPPVVRTSEVVAESRPRRALLLVAIVVIIAIPLAVVSPLGLRHGILVLLLLLPTVNAVMSITKANREEEEEGSNMTADTPAPTLREFLSHPDGFHMGFAPAFFGFFAYFGALAAMEEETNGLVVPTLPVERHRGDDDIGDDADNTTSHRLRSVSGASAGAMAAVMLAAGIQPRDAAEFASTFTWGMVADPPGYGGYVKGDNFEEAMREFIGRQHRAANNRPSPPSAVGSDGKGQDVPAPAPVAGLRLEEGLVPVAVSAFDLLRMRGTNLIEGCMARAARSSAGFPGLFQPVAWREGRRVGESSDGGESWLPDSLLIDGGIADGLGLNGLGALPSSDAKTKRVINLVVGDFGYQGPSGIKDVPTGVNAEYLVSIAITGTPMCGPWAMKNGPRAFESARKAMAAALDKPMAKGTCDNHHIIRVDASKWME